MDFQKSLEAFKRRLFTSEYEAYVICVSRNNITLKIARYKYIRVLILRAVKFIA